MNSSCKVQLTQKRAKLEAKYKRNYVFLFLFYVGPLLYDLIDVIILSLT